MTTVTMPNGVVGTSTYDNASRLTGISYVKSSVTLASVSYTVDAVGNRTDRTDLAGTESYSYDDYRLTSVTYPGPTTTDYTYDDFGNRTSMTDGAGTTNYAYDDAGRLTTVTPPSPASAISYTSDDNGNVIARGGDSFTWDFENRLTAATVNSTSYTYTYRGDGLRDTATTGGNTTTFTWDVNAALPVVLDDGSQYVYGNGLVSQVAGGNTYYYLTDGLGSVMATTNASGVVVNSYTYDVYGKTTATSGAQANDRQFAGQQTDPTGLQYLRARYYDPSTGSFLSRDPLSAGPAWAGNPFGYAGGNPAAVIDPSGWSGLPCSAGPSGDDGDKPGSQCAGSSLGGGGGNSFGGIPGGGDEGAEPGPLEGPEATTGEYPKTRGGRGPVDAGNEGQAASGVERNTARIPSYSGTANYRVPDGLSDTDIVEVKNVGKLSLTAQIRDDILAAKYLGSQFTLYIRETTIVSGPLLAEIEAGNINLRFLP